MSSHSSRGAEWERVRNEVLIEAGHTCVVNGCNRTATHVDHILAKSKGGTDDKANLQAMCAKHNLAKGDKVEFRKAWLNPKWKLDFSL